MITIFWLNVFTAVVIAILFGSWQHSFIAGLFMSGIVFAWLIK